MGQICPLNDFLSISTERKNNHLFSSGVMLALRGVIHALYLQGVGTVTMFQTGVLARSRHLSPLAVEGPVPAVRVVLRFPFSGTLMQCQDSMPMPDCAKYHHPAAHILLGAR